MGDKEFGVELGSVTSLQLMIAHDRSGRGSVMVCGGGGGITITGRTENATELYYNVIELIAVVPTGSPSRGGDVTVSV